MKHMYLTILLAAHCALPGIASAQRSVSARATEAASARQAKEGELERILEQYAAAAPAQQESLRQQGQALIYAIFDLRLDQLESEAAALRSQIEQLSAQTASLAHSEEIQRIRQSLLDLEKVLAFRRQNRETIVRRRVEELFR
jgi:hypothetical protein